MSALKQYTELYRANSGLIGQSSATPLNRLRPEACLTLENTVLPKAGSENYENTDLEALLSPDYALNLARIPMDVNPAATFRCEVPTLSTNLFMIINERFAETPRSREGLPEGVEIGSLRSMALDYPELVEKYYGKIAEMANPITALDTLLSQDGLFLRVKKGTVVEKPLQLVNILQYSMTAMVCRRLLIIIEDEAQAKLLVCDHTQNPDNDLLNVETVEIFVGENASFDYYALEESSERTRRLSTLYLEQGAGSHVIIDGITLFNGYSRNEYYCRFTGENAELRLLGMGIEDESRSISTYTHISHDVPHCHSDELFKFTLDDKAQGSFTGRIYVAPGAVKTEAYQSNRNLVSTDTARMISKPELEIYNDDVKCSHGCAIGQLDAMQLFYMRTRGLDESTARLLLKQAFMADVISGVRIDSLRDRLHMLVERRYAGLESACSDCQACHKTI